MTSSLSQMGPQDYMQFDMMNNMPKQYNPYYYDHRMKSVMDPQTQYTMDLIGLTSDQQSLPDMKQEYCRDYQRGKCMRGNKCKYRHADNIDINVREPQNKIVFCRNFQRGKCSLPNCKYLHLSRADEEFYFQTGALPTHDNNYNGYLHNFQNSNSTEPPTSALAALAKPFQPANLPSLTAPTQPNGLDSVSSIPISSEQPLQDPFFKHSPPKSESPFSPTSELSPSEKSKTPPQKSLSHSTQSISEYIGGKSDAMRTRRWSIDNPDQTDEMPPKLSPLSLTPRDEAFKNPESDLMKIKVLQLEEKVKSLEFYVDMLREQNVQLRQQVKRYENPFSPIYKPIILEDNEVASSN